MKTNFNTQAIESLSRPDRLHSILDKVRLPSEIHLSQELSQLSALFNDTVLEKKETNIEFALDQHVLNVSLLELNQNVSKKIYSILSRLNVEHEDIYIRLMPSKSHNAFCIHNQFNGNLVIGLNSGILDYSLDSIRFIIGHELGHHHLHHTRNEHTKRIKSASNHPLFRQACTLSRHQEISADRFGLLCCDGNIKTALSTLKQTVLQSVGKNLESIPKLQPLYQFYDVGLDGYIPWECTHPHITLRSEALIAWAPIAQQILDRSPVSKPDLAAVNSQCEKLLAGMDHDDDKKPQLLEEFYKALGVIELTLLDPVERCVFSVHTMRLKQHDSFSYEDAVAYLNKAASPGKRIRILDWLTSCSFIHKNPLDLQNKLQRLAEELNIFAVYKKRMIAMNSHHDFIAKHLN